MSTPSLEQCGRGPGTDRIIALAGVIVGVLGILGGQQIGERQTRLAEQQTELAVTQVRLAQEQMRQKSKAIHMSGFWGVPTNVKERPVDPDGPAMWYIGPPMPEARMLYVHLENVGELDIDKKDFELGPYIEFDGAVVVAAKVAGDATDDLRVKVGVKDNKYVEIEPLVEFKTDDRMAISILTNGDIGTPKFTFRVRGGNHGTKPLLLDRFEPIIAAPPSVSPE